MRDTSFLNAMLIYYRWVIAMTIEVVSCDAFVDIEGRSVDN